MKQMIIILATLSLSGCILSVYPLYTEQQVVSDPALVGTWQEPDGDSQWTFSGGEKGHYEVVIDGDPLKGVLLELDRVRFLDLFPGERTKNQGEWFELHFAPAHSFFRLQLKGDDLELTMMNPNLLEELLDKDPKALAHKPQKVDGGPGILTANTAELQTFIKAHPDLFDEDPAVLKRVDKPETAPAGGADGSETP